jgi:subtilisin family serine protease
VDGKPIWKSSPAFNDCIMLRPNSRYCDQHLEANSGLQTTLALVDPVEGYAAYPRGFLSDKDVQAFSEPYRFWNLELIRKVLKPSSSTPRAKVVIMDTGIDFTHPAFHPDTIKGLISFVPGQSAWWDGNGHGTHVAGTIAGKRFGIAEGLCELYIVKVLGNNMVGNLDWIIKGLDWIIENNQKFDVVSLSLGGFGQSPILYDKMRAVEATGAIIVCAAGNDGRLHTSTIGQPANYGGLLCVGSHNRNGEESNFSAIGQALDILAPGVNIISACPVWFKQEEYGSQFVSL